MSPLNSPVPLRLVSLQTVQQIGKLVQFLFGDFEGAASSERLRKLVPVVREFSPELRRFGTVLVARLTEKNLSRGLNWASQRLGQRMDDQRRRREEIGLFGVPTPAAFNPRRR